LRSFPTLILRMGNEQALNLWRVNLHEKACLLDPESAGTGAVVINTTIVSGEVIEEARISSQGEAMATLTGYHEPRLVEAYLLSTMERRWPLPEFFEHVLMRKNNKDHDYWSVFEPLKQSAL
jgi:hypothetical protein